MAFYINFGEINFNYSYIVLKNYFFIYSSAKADTELINYYILLFTSPKFIRRRKPTPNLLTITSYFLLPKNSVGIFGRGWKNFFKLLIIHLQAGLY